MNERTDERKSERTQERKSARVQRCKGAKVLVQGCHSTTGWHEGGGWGAYGTYGDVTWGAFLTPGDPLYVRVPHLTDFESERDREGIGGGEARMREVDQVCKYASMQGRKDARMDG